ncbi:MAG TPA: endonuclease/exonuclease/phosphatase family protein [Thermoanaerobaculia bacterium]|nr:endonuclease/exonuclease/phosphatase family protein [Thermoanaerobaculia bacterium]
MSSLKIMSYNIQGHAAIRREDHLPKLAEVIAAVRPDVVGLQEVHNHTRVGPIHQGEALAHLTGMNLHFGRSTIMDGGEYGNAVLTRGAIKSAYVYPLPGSGEPRSVLQTDIALGDFDFTFFVTHLAAWGRLLKMARMRQIAELGDITARGALPHVLVGDFNVPPAADEIQTLLSHGHLRICGDVREATFPMTRQRLDYVFCDPRWEFVRADVIRRGPSDHWAIVVELNLRTGV